MFVVSFIVNSVVLMVVNVMLLCVSRWLNIGSLYRGFIYWMCCVSDYVYMMSNVMLMVVIGVGVCRYMFSVIYVSVLILWC